MVNFCDMKDYNLLFKKLDLLFRVDERVVNYFKSRYFFENILKRVESNSLDLVKLHKYFCKFFTPLIYNPIILGVVHKNLSFIKVYAFYRLFFK